MLRRTATHALHGLLRNSVAAAELPASACSGQLTALRLVAGTFEARVSGGRASVRRVAVHIALGDAVAHRSCRML